MTNEGKIKLNLRFITPILALLTLLGITFSIYKKPYKWDEAADKVVELAKKSAEHDVALAVIMNQLRDMSSDLKEIKRAVK